MYYFLTQNLTEPLNIIEVVGHTEETGKYIWIDGNRFPEGVPFQTLSLDPTYGTRMADFFDTTIPLMSDCLLQTLRDAGVDNIDTYPMILERPDTGQKWDNYKAVNIIGRINAVDMEKSVYELDALDSPEFESIIIDPEAIGDAICFRLAEGPGLIVVHEKVAEAVRQQNFVAVMIARTEDYDNI